MKRDESCENTLLDIKLRKLKRKNEHVKSKKKCKSKSSEAEKAWLMSGHDTFDF